MLDREASEPIREPQAKLLNLGDTGLLQRQATHRLGLVDPERRRITQRVTSERLDRRIELEAGERHFRLRGGNSHGRVDDSGGKEEGSHHLGKDSTGELNDGRRKRGGAGSLPGLKSQE